MPTGYIYEIKSMDKSITGTYIGSCWDMKDRLRTHVGFCYNENSKEYNFPVYKYIREKGDFHTFNMRVIDSGECEDRTELECGEQFYIDMAGGIENLLNSQDALVLPEESRKRKDIAGKKLAKKNKETNRFPCEICGVCFYYNANLQTHLKTPKHLTKVEISTTK